MPASVKELYTYNPEKAKALLKEAGYSSGFKTWIDTRLTEGAVDYYSILKDMWVKVGVQLEIRPTDDGTFAARKTNKTFEQIVGTPGHGNSLLLYRMPWFTPDAVPNVGEINDPVINEARNKIQPAMVMGQSAADRLHRELMKYVLDQAWAIPRPQVALYTIWSPWIKNYSGEMSIGYGNTPSFAQFIWLDQALKKSMGY